MKRQTKPETIVRNILQGAIRTMQACGEAPWALPVGTEWAYRTRCHGLDESVCRFVRSRIGGGWCEYRGPRGRWQANLNGHSNTFVGKPRCLDAAPQVIPPRPTAPTQEQAAARVHRAIHRLLGNRILLAPLLSVGHYGTDEDEYAVIADPGGQVTEHGNPWAAALDFVRRVGPETAMALADPPEPEEDERPEDGDPGPGWWNDAQMPQAGASLATAGIAVGVCR